MSGKGLLNYESIFPDKECFTYDEQVMDFISSRLQP